MREQAIEAMARAIFNTTLHEAKRMLDPLYARRHPDHG